MTVRCRCEEYTEYERAFCSEHDGRLNNSIDVLRSFAESRAADVAVVPGLTYGHARELLSLLSRQADGVSARLARIRAAGWVVAVHNDYRLAGEPHTFWLFTRGARNVKGEGCSDEYALEQVERQLQDPALGER